MKTLLPVAAVIYVALVAVGSASAQIWTQTGAPTNYYWGSIVSSADGNKLAALAEVPIGGGSFLPAVYTSTNGGRDWTSNGLPTYLGFPRNLTVLAGSTDGSELVGAKDNGPSVVDISSNSGLSWAIVTNYADTFWNSAACSADGRISAFGADLGRVFVSTNSGAGWNIFTLPHSGGPGAYAALSTDGNRLVVIVNSGGVYSTTNFGASWITNNPSAPPLSTLAASADASKLVILSGGGQIYTSADFGNTWVQQVNAPSLPWSAVASSAGATRLVAVTGTLVSGPIYTSTDSGVTWISNNAPIQVWSSVASSADGNKMYATAFTNGIWTLQTTPVPQLNISASNTNLTFSWIVPSTNFVLQENSNLTTANWLTMTNTPMLNLSNMNNEVVLSPSDSSGFFRLMAQ